MAALAGFGASVSWAGYANAALSNEVLTDSGDHQTFNISTGSFATKRVWDRAAAFTIQTQCDEVQTVTITGSPTGGTFTLTFGGQTTAAINWNDSAATVQTRLQALSSIGSNNATVTGGPGPATPFTVEFVGTLADASQSLITLNNNSLTGGSGPSVSITRAQAGQGWTTIAATTYTLRYVCGQVFLAVALQGSNLGCRVSSGAYLPINTAANAKMWEVVPTVNKLDSTVFGGRWKTYVPGIIDAPIKITQWWADGTWITVVNQTNGANLLVVELYTGRSTYERYSGFAHLDGDDVKVPVNALIEEPLSLISDGKLYYFAGQYA